MFFLGSWHVLTQLMHIASEVILAREMPGGGEWAVPFLFTVESSSYLPEWKPPVEDHVSMTFSESNPYVGDEIHSFQNQDEPEQSFDPPV